MSSASSSPSAVPPPPPPPAPPPPPPPPPPAAPPPPPLQHHTGLPLSLPHQRLYDFARTALIKIFASPYASVCDLYCGGGADIDKWDEAQIGHYIGVDASMSGIAEARETWEGQRKPYTAEFHELDPSVENLQFYLQDKGLPVDIVCCMQHLQLCFESEERARRLLCNVTSLLKPGGYFFGITPDSSTIWTKYQKNVEASHNKAGGLKPGSVPNSIRSENYIITFETEDEKFPFFGKKYQLKFANDIITQTHRLVHFASLIRLAREAGLEYVEIQNLAEFYDDNRAQFAGMLFNYGSNFVDPRGKLVARSFDILGLYAVFVFQKPDLDVGPPISTPALEDGGHMHEDSEWSGGGWRQGSSSVVDEETDHSDSNQNLSNILPVVVTGVDKGILGPGPADLRFSGLI